MANKFQKSVMDRLEQEAVRQKQNKPSGITEPQPAPIKSKKEPTAAQESDHAKAVSTALDVQEYLIREPRRQAKNKTFYLDEDVINAVKATARQQKVNDSKLVNDILRHVLGLPIGNHLLD